MFIHFYSRFRVHLWAANMLWLHRGMCQYKCACLQPSTCTRICARAIVVQRENGWVCNHKYKHQYMRKNAHAIIYTGPKTCEFSQMQT